MDERLRKLIFAAIDRSISNKEFDQLQDAIESSDEVRDEYLRAVGMSESLNEIASELSGAADPGNHSADHFEAAASQTHSTIPERSATRRDMRSAKWISLSTVLLVSVGAVAFWFGQLSGSVQIVDSEIPLEPEETLIAGHAMLCRSVDVQWSDGHRTYRDGDVLPNGTIQFEKGVAEIDFFCGASLIVEGPAVLEVESDWSVRLVKGRLRANVPPAARGFIVKAADSEIIDLGTEFALEVGAESARIEVIDGEVELRGGSNSGNHLTTGQGKWLKGDGDQVESLESMTNLKDIQNRSESAASRRFAEWQNHSQQLREDNRLIAYFPMADASKSRLVKNMASTDVASHGTIVGTVGREIGRFGSQSYGLRFDRPGARVRTRIDGEFQAFTCMCWAKIDSLEHVYNAIFMSDGYETGELHWQINQDGRLMFSVMVDDTDHIRHFSKHDQRFVETAGRARVYFSEPFWDISKSGQWFHLAAVFDPVKRQVRQYVNGQVVGQAEIIDKFYINTLKIGAAEIGNWGQPFRNTPWFAVRNLNGTIDELAIFDASLSPTEVQSLYTKGKPLGY